MRARRGLTVALALMAGPLCAGCLWLFAATTGHTQSPRSQPVHVAQMAPPTKSPFGIAPPAATGAQRAAKPAADAGIFERCVPTSGVHLCESGEHLVAGCRGLNAFFGEEERGDVAGEDGPGFVVLGDRVCEQVGERRHAGLGRQVGAGLSLAQFSRAKAEGTVRHVGLPESVQMIADSLGFKLERVEETLEPAIAPRDLNTDYLRIAAGTAAGIKQSARGYFKNGELAVSLDLHMYVGADSPRDHVVIDGSPTIDMMVKGGIAGDIATAAISVNAIPKVMCARPGVVTMRDIPLIHSYNKEEARNPPKKYGSADAMNMGGPGSPSFVFGSAEIGKLVSGGKLDEPSPVNWAPDRVIVASSGDLGVTIGTIHRNDKSASFPFFTVWRRASPTDPWRYIAE